MKNALFLSSSVALAVVFCLAGTHVASALVSDQETHEFQHLGSPLWTSQATYLDRGNRTADELLAIAARSPWTAEGTAETALSIDSETASVGEVVNDVAFDQRLDPQHVAWCASKYRSYRAGDNSYRAFSGERRTCMSPYIETEMVATETASYVDAGSVEVEMPVIEADYVGSGAGSAWCQARYRSYRASDNTYQPYSGGPRRLCTLPNPAY